MHYTQASCGAAATRVSIARTAPLGRPSTRWRAPRTSNGPWGGGLNAMKLWWRVAVFIACAGVVALVVQWLQSRQATQWSTTRTRAERGDARAQFDLASGYYYGKG